MKEEEKSKKVVAKTGITSMANGITKEEKNKSAMGRSANVAALYRRFISASRYIVTNYSNVNEKCSNDHDRRKGKRERCYTARGGH